MKMFWPRFCHCMLRSVTGYLSMSSSSIARPPPLSLRAVKHVVLIHFPFKCVDESTVEEFVSYDDRNYYFRGETLASRDSPTDEYVLKVTNRRDVPELVVGLSQITHHLHQKGYRCPHPIPTSLGSAGDMIVMNKKQLQSYESGTYGNDKKANGSVAGMNDGSEEEERYAVRVLVFIPGELLINVPQNPQLLFKVGYYIGSLDRDLKDFSHPAVESRQYPLWDMQVLLNCRSLLPSIQDLDKQHMLQQIFDGFEKHVTPNIPSFTRGVIHNDANDMNILVEKSTEDCYNVSGIIDFGDCMESCYIFELAIMMAYSMYNKEKPVEFIIPMLAGYLNSFPLSEKELDCLYYSVLGRLAQTCANGEHQYQLDPSNEYLLACARPAWSVISLLLQMGKTEVDQVWAKAKGKTLEDFAQ